MKKLYIFVVLIYLGHFSPAVASEKILRFHSDIVINPDASLTVTETITVRAEGTQIRRGIYRDFPTRYQNSYGNRVVVLFQPLELLRDGKPEPWFTERRPNGVRVNFGDDSFLPVPLETTYQFRYQASRQLGFFADHDELYWNVTGNGWAFPIDQASARVQLPRPVTGEELQLEFYTGPQGSREKAASAHVLQPGVVEFVTTAPLAVNEGLTAVVDFPKGLVVAPSRLEELGWFVRDNWLLLVLFAGVLIVICFSLRQWRRHGVDPRPGPVFPRYFPPENFSAGTLRYLEKGGYGDRCLAADLVQLATLGCLTIRCEKKFGGDKWILEKKIPPTGQYDVPALRRLWGSLFHSVQRVELGPDGGDRLRVVVKNHERELRRVIKPRYLIWNSHYAARNWWISAVVIALAFVTAFYYQSLPTLLLTFFIVGFLIVWNIWVGKLMRRPTHDGRKLLDHIAGLRLYMRVASRDEIAALKMEAEQEPLLDAERFKSLLPFALALDVEDAWTDRFIDAVGTATAIESLQGSDWYIAPSGINSLNSISSLGGSFCSTISSSATPPGSVSAGGGGGFSGGGGGGGGR